MYRYTPRVPSHSTTHTQKRPRSCRNKQKRKREKSTRKRKKEREREREETFRTRALIRARPTYGRLISPRIEIIVHTLYGSVPLPERTLRYVPI